MEIKRLGHLIFITGAESTGKSTLTAELADRFKAPGVPEYARTYLELLGRPYSFNDVESIARKQISLINSHKDSNLVFFDTCLINLKVWFREVYQTVPHWLEDEIPRSGRGVYLLCEPDLPWQYDPIRENPYRREYLTEQYEMELNTAGFTYFRVSGTGEVRTENAAEIVNRVINPGFGNK